MSLATRKSIADLQEEAAKATLRRALGPLNLTALGIGSVIGTGIFVLTGTAASQNAGPALVLSMIIAAVACALAGLCYAELASMIPVAGSAYLVAPVDSDALHQIVINLLDNAIKYGDREGRVMLRTRFANGHARIEVEDSGPGVVPADRSRIWEPFVRIGQGSSIPGSGIGLTVVRELVMAHGGKAWGVETSTGGARFVVELRGASLVEATSQPSAGRVMEV